MKKKFYIDTHCHLDIINQDKNIIKQNIDNARNRNVDLLFNISVNFRQFFKFARLLKEYANIFYTLGLSPNDIADKPLTPKDIEGLLEKGYRDYKDKIIGIGEIGLDYYWNRDNIDLQKEIFLLQIKFAETHKFPIILHIRDAWADTVSLLKNLGSKFHFPIIFHCFSGNSAIVKETLALNLDIYYSFAGNLTYKNAKELQEAFLGIPLNKIIFETDSPYLTPVPFRGQKNAPDKIVYTYKFGADLRKMEEEILIEKVMENVKKAFDQNLLGSFSGIFK